MASSRPAAASRKDPALAPRRRLGADERERQIVEGAVAYFAEVGLDGQTRELARRLGIAQPLLFRYFPTKGALIERIYADVYLKRWKPEWEEIIADAALSTAERFRRFELDYQRTIDDYAWLRIFVSAGLKGYDLPRRYLGTVRERVFTPLLVAMRAEHGLPSPAERPLEPAEHELLLGIHGSLVYVALRTLVYGLEGPPDRDEARAALLDAALPGLGPAYRRLVANTGARDERQRRLPVRTSSG